jgi:hypothetical protein
MQFLTAQQDQMITGQIIKKTPRGKFVVSVGKGHVIASGMSGFDVGDGVTLLRTGRSYQIISSFITSYGRSIREIFVKM